MTTEEFSFAKFSMNAFYASLNARLVDMVDLGPNQRIVDMACGTGAVTRIIVERLKGARDSVIIALDQSASGLKQAMEELKDVRDSAVEFVQSRVEHMSDAVKESVDTIFYSSTTPRSRQRVPRPRAARAGARARATSTTARSKPRRGARGSERRSRDPVQHPSRSIGTGCGETPPIPDR